METVQCHRTNSQLNLKEVRIIKNLNSQQTFCFRVNGA